MRKCLGSKRPVNAQFVATCPFCERRVQILRGRFVAHDSERWWKR